MTIPPEHLTYLRQKGYKAGPSDILSEEEAAALDRYGHELEAEVRAEVLRLGQSVRREGVWAVFSRGRVTWDSKGLTQYAQAHPEVEKFRKVGKPIVAIRYKKP
jgi:hypothetical protein